MKFKHAALILLTLILLIDPLSASAAATEEDSAEPQPIYLAILMYHEVKYNKAGKDAILPWEFESDLKYLKENHYTTITMAELIGYVYHNLPLPQKPIILSFDDGYLNNYVYVLPLLKKYRMKIVFSIIGKNTDDFTRIPDNNPDYSHVTWDQLDEMLDSGCAEVQNHSYNLHRYYKGRVGCRQMPGEPDEKYEILLREDVGKLQTEITENTGCTPTTFSYPYGAVCDNMDRILREMGFSATLSCKYGVNRITHDPECLFRLKRICRSHGESAEKLLAEAMKTVQK
jgi:peptidoglycan/xylan/chitin deacetylase (PgdA/CDA1 family)